MSKKLITLVSIVLVSLMLMLVFVGTAASSREGLLDLLPSEGEIPNGLSIASGMLDIDNTSIHDPGWPGCWKAVEATHYRLPGITYYFATGCYEDTQGRHYVVFIYKWPDGDIASKAAEKFLSPGMIPTTFQEHQAWKGTFTQDLNGHLYEDYEIIWIQEKYRVTCRGEASKTEVENYVNELAEVTERKISEKSTPGFGAIFAIAGLLAVAYLFRKRKMKGR